MIFCICGQILKSLAWKLTELTILPHFFGKKINFEGRKLVQLISKTETALNGSWRFCWYKNYGREVFRAETIGVQSFFNNFSLLHPYGGMSVWYIGLYIYSTLKYENFSRLNFSFNETNSFSCQSKIHKIRSEWWLFSEHDEIDTAILVVYLWENLDLGALNCGHRWYLKF